MCGSVCILAQNIIKNHYKPMLYYVIELISKIKMIAEIMEYIEKMIEEIKNLVIDID